MIVFVLSMPHCWRGRMLALPLMGLVSGLMLRGGTRFAIARC